MLALDADGVVWTFSFSSLPYFLPPSLWKTARYRLKYCLKVKTKTTSQAIDRQEMYKYVFVAFIKEVNEKLSFMTINNASETK